MSKHSTTIIWTYYTDYTIWVHLPVLFSWFLEDPIFYIEMRIASVQVSYGQIEESYFLYWNLNSLCRFHAYIPPRLVYAAKKRTINMTLHLLLGLASLTKKLANWPPNYHKTAGTFPQIFCTPLIQWISFLLGVVVVSRGEWVVTRSDQGWCPGDGVQWGSGGVQGGRCLVWWGDGGDRGDGDQGVTSLPQQTRHLPPSGHVTYPMMHFMCPPHPPAPQLDRMTDACENITFTIIITL